MKKNLSFLSFLFVFSLVFFYLLDCGKQSNSQEEADTKKEARFNMAQVRKPAVAGQFYTGDPVALTKELTDFFSRAQKEPIPGEIIALIAPHAGYMYSGQVAAYAFKLLEGLSFETVVVISPSHIAYFPGASVYNGGAYETPLGKIPVDTVLAGKLADQNQKIFLSDKGHGFVGIRGEHALEVELPFLQTVLGKFKLVAIVVGDQDYGTCQALGQALAGALKGENALIVASSDLSHFHPYQKAVRLDNIVIGHVNSFDPEGLYEDLSSGACEACGGGPIAATMIAAKGLGADKAKVLKYANSGDVTGDKSGVVGYMAAVMYNSQADPKKEKKRSKEEKVGADLGLSQQDKKILMDIARKTIESRVKGEKLPKFEVDSPILKENRGAFVTIKEHGQLRGCIGYMEAIRPLYITVQEMAESAALKDPRFPPVTPAELDKLELEISVLTPLRKIKHIEEIEIGKHGILLKKGYQQGVFLPQVATEQGWDRITFLEQICHKAGIYDKNCWKDEEAEIYIYSAEVF